MNKNSDRLKDRIRVRACGVLIEDDKVLLIQVHSPIINELIWTAPGGGIEFGESVKDAIKREFKEETGLIVRPGELLVTNELIQPPYHVFEFYHQVECIEGTVMLGKDPELSEMNQLLKDLRFFDKESLKSLTVEPNELKRILIEKMK